MTNLAAILCADWSKEARRRAVFAADVGRRLVYRPKCEVNWSVGSVLREAERMASKGSVLVGFDAPLSVPLSYLQAATQMPSSFLEWLSAAYRTPALFEACKKPEEWAIERPFFAVPAGDGGLKSFRDAAARFGVELHRKIDQQTKAKSVFIKSGIPGSVGSAACALWAELGPMLTVGRSFSVWPFDGELASLVGAGTIVTGEIYPRAAYATALSDEPVELRAPISLAKTDRSTRQAAIELLLLAAWVRKHEVRFEDLNYAMASEDEFDACLNAAALLRCALEGEMFCSKAIDGYEAEGGILGTGSINLGLSERSAGAGRALRLR